MSQKLPQFQTPTPSYRGTRFYRLPNYSEIWARNFASSAETTRRGFSALSNTIISAVKAKEARDKEFFDYTREGGTVDMAIETAGKEAGNYNQRVISAYTEKGEIIKQKKKAVREAKGRKKRELRAELKAYEQELTKGLATSATAGKVLTEMSSFIGDDRNNISYFQGDTLMQGLLYELNENQGRDVKFVVDADGKDAFKYTDFMGEEQIVTAEYIANYDFEQYLQKRIDFSSADADGTKVIDAIEQDIRDAGQFNTSFDINDQIVNGVQVSVLSNKYSGESIKGLREAIRESEVYNAQGKSFRAKLYFDEVVAPTDTIDEERQLDRLLDEYLLATGKEFNIVERDEAKFILSGYKESEDLQGVDDFERELREYQRKVIDKKFEDIVLQDRFLGTRNDEKADRITQRNVEKSSEDKITTLTSQKQIIENFDEVLSRIQEIVTPKLDNNSVQKVEKNLMFLGFEPKRSNYKKVTRESTKTPGVEVDSYTYALDDILIDSNTKAEELLGVYMKNNGIIGSASSIYSEYLQNLYQYGNPDAFETWKSRNLNRISKQLGELGFEEPFSQFIIED